MLLLCIRCKDNLILSVLGGIIFNNQKYDITYFKNNVSTVKIDVLSVNINNWKAVLKWTSWFQSDNFSD